MLTLEQYLIIFVPYGLTVCGAPFVALCKLLDVWQNPDLEAREKFSGWNVVMLVGMVGMLTLPLTPWLMEFPTR